VSELEDKLEYDHLKAFCWAEGLHAEIHRDFKPQLQRPGREQAFWYLQRLRKLNPELAPDEISILKFCTAAEIYDWVLEYKKKQAESRR
jgi:hypothetical protein